MPPRTVAIFGLVCLVAFAGCSGLYGGEEAGAELEFETAAHETIYVEITDSLESSEAEAFTGAISADGSITPEGTRLLEALWEIDKKIGVEERDAVARSIASQGAISEVTLAHIDVIRSSPESLQRAVFAHGVEKADNAALLEGELIAFGIEPGERPLAVQTAEVVREGGYTEVDVELLAGVGELDEAQYHLLIAVDSDLLEGVIHQGVARHEDARALEDDADDGLANVLTAHFSGDSATPAPEVGAFLDQVSADGIDDNDIHVLQAVGPAPDVLEFAVKLGPSDYTDLEVTYLQRVGDISHYQGHPYEVWTQAEELGLLYAAVENGSVSEADVWAIQNNASNRLLNGMEAEFGTDPEVADTSGDGFEDHLKWGPMRDLGLTVHPDEVDIYIEVESDRDAAAPSGTQQAQIESLFADEPAEDIGPVHIHFHEFRGNLDTISDTEDMHDRASERSVDGLGFHYLVMAESPFTADDQLVAGYAYNDPGGPSWMVVVGDYQTSFVTMTIAHEMGHAFGIMPHHFDGVDSHKYSASEYNSVMNYQVTDELTFSSGEPFDDWGWMAEQQFGAYHTDRSELHAIWEHGEVPDEPLVN